MATAYSLESFSKQPALKRAQAIEKGLPVSMLRKLVEDPAISVATLAGIVGPRRTLDRRLKENERLSQEESDRLAGFLSVLNRAAHIFGSRAAAMDWLDKPKSRFDGKRPLDLMKTHAGCRMVEELMILGQHGMLA